MAEGMRRRNVQSSSSDSDSGLRRGLDAVQNFDVFSKVNDDYLHKSQGGGIITVITSFIICILLWHELCEFFSVEVADTISVDTRINQKLPVGINISFPHLRCEEVSVDTVDSAGDNQVDVHGSLDKLSLGPNGFNVQERVSPGDCGSCMEAADEKHKCCNTCDDLKAAYTAKDLQYFGILDQAKQCANSVGCRVFGKVVVNKVGGNVHVALGRSTIREGKHVHEFNMHDVTDGFNTSHEIHSITFGDKVPGVMSPLDGTTKIVKHGAYMFHYYIKLVPTVFASRWGDEVYTNQYSVTDSSRNVQVRNGELSGLPGVFIVYDFSPFLMRKIEKTKPWSYIFTSICAIIGGIFSIAVLVEMIVHNTICKVFGCVPGAGL